jgi:hypothetical protein
MGSDCSWNMVQKVPAIFAASPLPLRLLLLPVAGRLRT